MTEASTTKKKAMALAEALSDHKAIDVQVLDLRELTSFTDYFVIATATSDRHARTLGDAAVECVRALGERPLGVEGTERAQWILVDTGDVVVHVFNERSREFYSLERLWGEAEPVEVAAGVGA